MNNYEQNSEDNLDLSADVIVVGGGPAGSATATMLSRKGWKVIILEREKFPRDHVGESLLPASIPILEELGALPDVEKAGFLPKYGAHIRAQPLFAMVECSICARTGDGLH